MLKKTSNPYRGLLFAKKSSQRRSQRWTINMIESIINLSDNQGQQYISKNSIDQLLIRIDKNHIEIIDKFSNYKQNGFNLLQFVRFFLNIIHHQQIENLYLTIGLIDLFKTVSIFAGEQKVTFSHITNFFCQKILEKQQSKNQIEAKNIPEITYIKPNYQIKDFIKNPPTIFGSNDDTLYKLSQNSILTDKSKHLRAVNSSQFSYDLKMIFTLDALSQCIAVYDFNCCQINKIYPSFSKIKKDVVVLSFAFSQRQYRIGSVLKNFSIVFWDCCPNNSFDYQKSWTTTSYCQHLQSSIYYLDYFNHWITSDKTGTLYFWDILNSKPNRQFKCKYYSNVNILCQIPTLNILAVVQESKNLEADQHIHFNSNNALHHEKKNLFYQCNIILYNFFNGEILNEISCPDDRVPHTIQYSQQYQILFSAGLQKKIKLWQISPLYMDSNLKGQLIGHQNLITSFTILKKTSLIVSCDDKGKIKLWDFKNFGCIQTIDFSDKAMITNLLDMIQIGKIGILGSRIHYIDFEDKNQIIKKIKSKQKITIEWIDYDQYRNEIYLFTQKDLRVLDLYKGSIKYIYGYFNSQDNDITCFKYFSCICKFIIGNDKGEICVYDIGTGSFLYKLKTGHDGSIIAVEYDQLNKLFISIGSDSSILIHRQNSKQLIRQIKGNYYNKQISCFQLSVYHNLIAISTHEKQFNRNVFIWNYQFGKLSGQVVILQGDQVASLKFINYYNVLVIGTTNGILHLIQIKQLASSQIKIQQLIHYQLKKSINSLNCDIVLKGGNKSQLQQCIFIVSFQDGTFKEINITNYIKKLQHIPHSRQKTNYNPYRESKQTFSMQYMKKKHYKLILAGLEPKKILQNQVLYKTRSNIKHKTQPFSMKRIQTQVCIDIQQSQQLDQCQYQQLNKNIGTTKKLPQQKHKQKQKQKLKQKQSQNQNTTQHLSSNQTTTKKPLPSFQQHLSSPIVISSSYTINNNNTNNNHNSINSIPKQQFQISSPIKTNFSQINVLKIMNYQKRFILIIGNNKRFTIYNHQYKLVCDLNINYPLPYLWEFKPKIHKKLQDKIYFGIKVLNSILNKYQNDISVGQAKNFKLKELFDKINRKNPLGISCMPKGKRSSQQFGNIMLTEPNIKVQKSKIQVQQKIPLIQEQYTKNDLNFQLVKEYNFHEVAGPTLKELDHIKKIQLLQKQWRQKQRQQQQDCDKLLKMIQTKGRKNEEKQELACFLSPSTKNKDSKQNPYILNLRKKIDNLRISGQKDQDNKDNKQKGISLFNTSKLMNFTTSLNMNKKQSKKDKQDQSLLEACMKKYKSVKYLKKIDAVSTFQDYYLTKKVSYQQSQYVKSRVHTSNDIDDFRISKAESDKKNSFTKTNFYLAKVGNNTEALTLEKKPKTAGKQFRRILTQMNEKVREKKLERLKYL